MTPFLRNLVLCIILLTSLQSVTAQISLVKDINTQIIEDASGNPQNFFVWNDVVYYTAFTAETGYELWKTNGTEAGTTLVRDIAQGFSSSRPEAFTEMNGFLYFSADDGIHGRELWQTDGTSAGTTLVHDVNPGAKASNPANLLVINSTLFFSARTTTHGIELWKTNGLTTQLVKDINPGALPSTPQYFVALNNKLYFNAVDTEENQELWTSDGTAAGTFLLVDLVPGNTGSRPWYLTALNGMIYFRTNDASGEELWKSNGTDTGTVRIGQTEGAYNSFLATPNHVYYIEWSSSTAFTINKINTAGTISVIENLASTPETIYNMMTLQLAGNDLHYSFQRKEAMFPDRTLEMRVISDVNGSILLTRSESVFDDFIGGSGITKGNDNVYFLSVHNAFVNKLYQVQDNVYTLLGSFDGLFRAAAFANNKFIFSTAPVHSGDVELWASDGTESGTDILKETSANAGSGVMNLVEFQNQVYFKAFDGLWKSNGTAAGTVKVNSLMVDYYDLMKPVGNNLFIDANTSAEGEELWKTDGTTSTLVKDINPGTDSSYPSNFEELNGKLIFTAAHPTHGFSLWESDGTEAGTVLIKDLDASSTSEFGNFQILGKTETQIFFRYRDVAHGIEVWRTDGTTAGTYLIKDVEPGTAHSQPLDAMVLNGILYFNPGTSQNGRELWRSDGTEAGTFMVKDIYEGPETAEPRNFVKLTDTQFLFTSYASALWISDGTTGWHTLGERLPCVR